MIVKTESCSLCHKQIRPQDCDGKVYIPVYTSREGDPWQRPVRRGTDRQQFVNVAGELKFRIVVGHGDSSLVALRYRADL